MIKVTDTASEHLKNISEANDGKIPCLGLKGGGCAGFSYDWTLKEEIVNPNSQSSCGCGESVNFNMEKIEANQDQITQLKG